MSIENKLNYLSTTKNLIKEAIKSKGVSVLDTDPFRDYANKINLIESGLPYTKANISSVCNGNDLYEVYDVVIDINGVKHTIPGVLGELIESGSSECLGNLCWTSNGVVEIRLQGSKTYKYSFDETSVCLDLNEYVEQGLDVYPLTNTYQMFYNQDYLLEVTQLPSLSEVTNAQYMFSATEQKPLRKIPRLTFSNKLTNATNIVMQTSVTEIDLSNSDFLNIELENYNGVIAANPNLTTLYLDGIKNLNITDTTKYFVNPTNKSLKTIYMRGSDQASINSINQALKNAFLSGIQIITE